MIQTIKKLWKPFVLIFFLSCLAINWSRVSWIFNYSALFRYASDFVEKSTQASQEVQTQEVQTNKIQGTQKQDSIEISKIGIVAPLIIDKSLDDKAVHKALDNGTVYYPGSVLPGETGQTIVLGHSAPVNWPKIKYDWVFSHLENLEENDEIIVNYNHQEFSYKVIAKEILDRGGEVPKNDLTNSKNILVLISCWPPGKDYKRIAVVAEIE